MRGDTLISDHKLQVPLPFIRLSCCLVGCFPVLDFTACAYWAAENKGNQCPPHPLRLYSPFLSTGDYWLDLKDFLRLPVNQFPLLEDDFGSIRVQNPSPPSCCWETTPVICVLSECIIESDMERERKREALAGEKGKNERERKREVGVHKEKLLHAHLLWLSLFLTLFLSKYTHLHTH